MSLLLLGVGGGRVEVVFLSPAKFDGRFVGKLNIESIHLKGSGFSAGRMQIESIYLKSCGFVSNSIYTT